MAVTQYVGARYVPMFAEPIEWVSTRTYEPLTIVYYQGNSYTSRQAVPTNIDINNDEYWALTGNYNAQIEQYRLEVQQFDGRITENSNDIAELQKHAEANNMLFINAKNPPSPAIACKGDGVTDDTSALQSCINLIANWTGAYNLKGGILAIPSGIYKITSALNINNHGMAIIGCGRQTTTILSESNDTAFNIQFSSSNTNIDTITVANMGLTNSNANNAIGINVNNFVNLTIKEINITNFTKGIVLTGATSPQSGSSNIIDIAIQSNKSKARGIEQNGSVVSIKYDNVSAKFTEDASTSGVGFFASGRIRDMLIDNFDFSQGRIGVQLVGTDFDYVTDIHIINSKFDNLTLYGIYGTQIKGTGGVNVHDCWFNMSTTAPSTIAIYFTNVIGACITDNVFTAVNETSLDVLRYTGIGINNCKSCVVQGNIIIGPLVGMNINTCSYIKISSNSISEIEYESTLKLNYGITIVSSDHVGINGNVLSGDYNNATINIPSTNTKIMTIGNIVNGNFSNNSIKGVNVNNITD